MAKPKTVHYVDNRKFYEALMEYKELKKVDPLAQIPEYIGECLLAIARKYSNRGNFSQYSFKEEFVSDALENCIQYLHNFDPEKSTNPFAYFTQIMHWAFVRRIGKEKRQTYTKYKYAINQSIMGEDYAIINGEDNDLKSPNWMSYSNVDVMIKDFEDKQEKKNKKYQEYKKRYDSGAVETIEDLEEDELFALSGEEDRDTMLDPVEVEEDFDDEDEVEEAPKKRGRKRKDEDEDADYEAPESLVLNGDYE